MGHVLMRRLLQNKALPGPVSEASLNLILGAEWLRDRVEQALTPVGITHTQYNVLRILRGAPAGHPRCEIARRMVVRAPDVTRIIDRLEARRLVRRARDPEDARRSLTQITRAGVVALDQGGEAIAPVEEEMARRLSPRQIEELSRICEALYGPEVE